jgi:hypothetical protein
MSRRQRLAAGAALICIACGGMAGGEPAGTTAGPRPPAPDLVLRPPAHGRVYHAAFPDFGGTEDVVSAGRIGAFERLARKRISWAYFSNNWLGGRVRFPIGRVKTISRAGRLPFVRVMPRSGWGHGVDPHFSLGSIVEGRWDAELTRWCDRARGTGIPLLAELGTEVNGDWFPWNGRWNGAGRTRGYGDPGLADGPERFRDAYRRIVGICRAESGSPPK